MKITMIGTGYVGLVTGTCLAEVGNDVVCLDVDARKIDVLQHGGVPIHEPGLEPMIHRNVAAGRLRFTTDVDAAVGHATVQFIAVGTPPDEDGSADMQYVLQAAHNIGRRMTQWTLVVDKSTVPVGTADRVRVAIAESLAARGVDIPYAVASNPEFLKEGAAIDDFMKPDRIVIGADDERAIGILRNVYAPFQRNRERLLVMDVRSAELTKYAANAMLATRISFMNELANLAELLGADIESVRQGIGSDPRIGWQFLYPGVGYGGSCFPKDVRAAVHRRTRRAPLKVLGAVEAANEIQKRVLVDKIVARFGNDLSQRASRCGDSRSPNTGRHARGTIARHHRRAAAEGCGGRRLRSRGDRRGEAHSRRCRDCRSLPVRSRPVRTPTRLVVVTEWKEFRSPDFDALRRHLRQPVIFDGRNLYEPDVVRSAGFEHFQSAVNDHAKGARFRNGATASRRRALVVGDVMLDRYWFGDVERISPEAPVPVVKIARTEERPGGAANVARNVAALGAHASLLSATGNDEPADALLRLLATDRISTSFLRDAALTTTVKLRVTAASSSACASTSKRRRPTSCWHRISTRSTGFAGAHALVLSDYGKGGLRAHRDDDRVRARRASPCSSTRKATTGTATGCYGHHAQSQRISPGRRAARDEGDLCAARARIAGNSSASRGALLVTRSEEGMSLAPDAGTLSIPAQAREVFSTLPAPATR